MTNRVFNATLDAVSTNKSKTVIKLSLSNKEAAVFAQRYLNSIDKELRVSFDDPQMEMDITPASGSSRGLVATISHNGVVETVKQQELGDDNDGDLFEQEAGRDYTGKEIVIKGLDESMEYVFRIVDGEAEYPFKWENGERVLGMNVDEVKREIGPMPLPKEGPTRYLVEELLGAFGGELRDIVSENEADEQTEPGSEEVEFEDGDAPTDPDPVDEEEDEDVPEPEKIEAFILSEKPVFESIPFNFPELIRQRREEDATWMNLARDAGVQSTKLQAAFRAYKKLVVAKMREQGVA